MFSFFLLSTVMIVALKSFLSENSNLLVILRLTPQNDFSFENWSCFSGQLYVEWFRNVSCTLSVCRGDWSSLMFFQSAWMLLFQQVIDLVRLTLQPLSLTFSWQKLRSHFSSHGLSCRLLFICPRPHSAGISLRLGQCASWNLGSLSLAALSGSSSLFHGHGHP